MSPSSIPPVNLPIPTLPSFQYGDGPDSVSLLDPLGPFWQDALHWNLLMWCVPSTAVLLANTPAGLAAYQNIEDSIIVPPGSFLLGFSAFSAQAAGFRWRIWDVGANSYALGSDRWLNNVTDGQDNSDTDAAVPNILPDPYCIVSPGELHIQLVNSASVANDIGLVVWIAKPNNRGVVIP